MLAGSLGALAGFLEALGESLGAFMGSLGALVELLEALGSPIGLRGLRGVSRVLKGVN